TAGPLPSACAARSIRAWKLLLGGWLNSGRANRAAPSSGMASARGANTLTRSRWKASCAASRALAALVGVVWTFLVVGVLPAHAGAASMNQARPRARQRNPRIGNILGEQSVSISSQD